MSNLRSLRRPMLVHTRMSTALLAGFPPSTPLGLICRGSPAPPTNVSAARISRRLPLFPRAMALSGWEPIRLPAGRRGRLRAHPYRSAAPHQARRLHLQQSICESNNGLFAIKASAARALHLPLPRAWNTCRGRPVHHQIARSSFCIGRSRPRPMIFGRARMALPSYLRTRLFEEAEFVRAHYGHTIPLQEQRSTRETSAPRASKREEMRRRTDTARRFSLKTLPPARPRSSIPVFFRAAQSRSRFRSSGTSSSQTAPRTGQMDRAGHTGACSIRCRLPFAVRWAVTPSASLDFNPTRMSHVAATSFSGTAGIRRGERKPLHRETVMRQSRDMDRCRRPTLTNTYGNCFSYNLFSIFAVRVPPVPPAGKAV
jgi:hypothetical protein